LVKGNPLTSREPQYPGECSRQTEEATGASLTSTPGFRLLLAAQLAADTANYAVLFAAMALVEGLTHSSTGMAWMIVSCTLPGLLFGPIAGVIVDRRDRVNVLVAGNALRLVAAGCFVWASGITSSCQSLLAVYLSCFVLSVAGQFIGPAQGAMTPKLAGRGSILLTANSLVYLLSLGAQGLGLVVLAPLLLNTGGPVAVGLMSMVLFGIAAVLDYRLPRETSRATVIQRRTLTDVWADLREGWYHIVHDGPLALATFQLTLVSSVGIMLSVLAPGLALRVFGTRVSDIAYLIVPVGVGFGLGLALVTKSGNRLSYARWICTGLISFGFSLAILALVRTWAWWALPSLLVAALGIGVGFALVNVPARTVLQERPPPEMRGRILATQGTLANAVNSLPLPLAGALADSTGITRMVSLLAVLVLGVGIMSRRHAAT